MRRFLVLVSFIALFVTCSAQAADSLPPLRVAVDAHYPPFAMHDAQGNLTGFDVEIAKALCHEIKRDCEIHAVAFGRILPGIVAGEYDLGVSGYTDTPERRELVDFTDKYFSSMSIFIQWGSKRYDLTPEGVKGLRIAVQSGTRQGEYAKELFGDAITVVSRDSFAETMGLLRSGAAELALMDSLAGFIFLKSPEGEEYEVVGDAQSISIHGDEARIAVSKKLPGLREKLNAAIQTIRHNGEYGKINRRYFEFNIY